MFLYLGARKLSDGDAQNIPQLTALNTGCQFCWHKHGVHRIIVVILSAYLLFLNSSVV
jgi:hypothetical protein